MKLIEINKEEFLNFAQDKDTNNFFQTREWAEVKRHEGWHTYFLGLEHDGKLEAVTMMLSRELPIIKKRIFYCPRGYIINYKDLELVRSFTKHIKNFITERNAVFLKINPYLSLMDLDENGDYVQGGYNNEKCIDILRSLGYIAINDNYSEPEYFYEIDLEDENLFKNFSKKAKDTIMSNDERGIYVEDVDDNSINEIFEIINNTSMKQDFSNSDIKDLYQVFKQSKMIDIKVVKLNLNKYMQSITTMEEKKEANKLLQKYQGDIILGCSVSICYTDTVTTIITAIKDEFKDLLSQYTLHYRTIKWAKTNNYKKYVFYGINGELKYNNYIYKYYKDFGGKLIKSLGEYCLIIRPFLYKIYYKYHKNRKITDFKKKKKNV